MPALHCEERVFLCCFFVIFQYEIGVVDHGVIDCFPFCLDFAGDFDMVTDIDVVVRVIGDDRHHRFVEGSCFYIQNRYIVVPFGDPDNCSVQFERGLRFNAVGQNFCAENCYDLFSVLVAALQVAFQCDVIENFVVLKNMLCKRSADKNTRMVLFVRLES